MKVAVAGLGFMGATHAAAWLKVPGAELAAVVSRDERKLTGDLTETGGNLGRQAARLDFSRTRKYRAIEEALGDPEIDAIDICFPTDLHARTAIAAVRSGKHALVEKPLALTGEDADQVVFEAKRAGAVLMTAQVLRFMPAYVAAREKIQILGPIRSAWFRRKCAAPVWSGWLREPARSGGGIFDLLIHDVDYARWLFGSPFTVRAYGIADDARGLDLVTAQLVYDGWSASISGGWHLETALPFSAEFTIVCEDGVLEYVSSTEKLILYQPDTTAEVIPLPQIDPFVAELAHFQDCVSRGESSPVCPPSESADAVRLMRQIVAGRQ